MIISGDWHTLQSPERSYNIVYIHFLPLCFQRLLKQTTQAREITKEAQLAV